MVSLIKQFTIFGFILGIFGIIFSWNYSRKIFYLVFTGFILAGFGFLAVARMPLDPYSLAKLERFYILPDSLFCVFTGLGFYWLWMKRYYLTRILRTSLLVLTFTALPLYLIFSNYRINEKEIWL